MLKTAARILTRTPKFDQITPVLASLHRLPVKVKARADFKILLLTYKALHRLAQIKVYLSRAPNTTVVNLTVKCLLTGSNQWCEKTCVCV